MTTITGTSGNDTITGGNGVDIIFGGDGDDILSGGNGIDALFGESGNDQLSGDNGADNLTGGDGDDLIDGKNGIDTAYYRGLIEEYAFVASAGYLHVLHLGGAGADGHDQLINVERLVFADRVINIGSGTNVPVAGDDHVFIDEDTNVYTSGAGGVLANDYDFDGDPLTVTGGTFTGSYGTLTLNADGTYSYTLFASDQALAEGENVADSFNYTVSDNDGSDTGTLVFHIAGVNDAPTANPDTATTGENQIVLIDVLANDDDVDNGAVLTVMDASAPPGQGTASVVGNQVQFDPGTDFDYLGEGETAEVIVDYTIEDEHGAQSVSTVTITVEGEDDPGAVIVGTPGDDNLTGTAGDDIITALGGDDSAFGLGGADLIDGGDGADFLSGDAGNDTVTGGNDDDIVTGGDGTDQLSGQAGNDSLSGDSGNDQLAGGDGFDSMSGEAGNDVLAGGNDGDFLSGGDGNDQLSGEAGNDVVIGESGDDQLSGGGGDDSLDGGAGDDNLDGGDGQDSLSGGLGTNVLNGGLGNDQITADSTDGAQTIDGGDGDDTIIHYYRSAGSTITTGLGRDTIQLAYANIGAAAITVTDFTAGSGGDIFQLEGGDGALLDLLSGWDGSSNPFGSAGFLRLQQSGSDTVLQWDQDGTAGGANWETLVVFQNTISGNFTDSNFVPGYPPDGSAPAGQTITGTNNGETLIGTIGDDTINALGGSDNVSGRAGADLIDGGDGGDILNGEGGDDIIAGGNDGDQLSGGDGNDDLSGQAGVDSLFGDNGDDELSGGADSDNLSGDAGNDVVAGDAGDDVLAGGEGDDSLDGGDGADILSDFIGTNSFAGGIGNDQITAGSSDGEQTIDGGDGDDTIIHYYRTNAGTIATGLGSDTIELAYANIGAAALVITDFTTGGGGDMFRLDGADGALLDQLSGWDGSSNPFGEFLRLQQSGSDTVLQWDPDGATGGENWETLVIFVNTTVGDFTEANFEPGYDPDGTAPAGETINGTAGDDFLEGTIGGDTINAFAGADSAFGMAGDDFIYGGDGVDNLYGNEDDDYIDGGNQDDQLSGGDGNDQLLGQAGDDIVFGENGDDQLSGGDGLDNLTGEAGADVIAGGNDDDVLSGGEDNDSLDGGAGNDLLTGGTGADLLTGGGGVDTFSFQLPSEGPDEITDFVSGSDLIQILASGFGGGLVEGGSVSLVSGSDPTATDASGQFLYDTDDGNLYWDEDGTGANAAVLIATLSNVPTLTTSDFVVI
ncbi:MAG TPA: Ig-like domain-containing protein [Allosphingosinicella sp.]|nr:Ig-like domain-containing protein [Allosphingosinicella sp.]